MALVAVDTVTLIVRLNDWLCTVLLSGDSEIIEDLRPRRIYLVRTEFIDKKRTVLRYNQIAIYHSSWPMLKAALIALSMAEAHETKAWGYRFKAIKRKDVSRFCKELAKGGQTNNSLGVSRKNISFGFS